MSTRPISDGRAPATDGYLGGLSALAGRSFASAQEAVAAILQLITELTGLRSSFASRIGREAGRHEVLAAHNLPDGTGLAAGTVWSLSDTF